MMKNLKAIRLFAYTLVMGLTMGLTSCSDDDDDKVDVVTVKHMYGAYEGKMLMTQESAGEGTALFDGDEEQAWTAIKATVNNDTIYFEDFPIRPIVAAIVGDSDAADAIVEAVGKVGYGIGYTPALAAAQDSISFAMNPKPLTLAVNLGGEGDEAQTLAVEVQVEAPQTGGYSVEDGNMKFHFVVSEVFLGEGDNRVALPGFAPITFDMDLNQARPAQHF